MPTRIEFLPALLLAGLVLAAPARADIYQSEDETGAPLFSDVRDGDGFRLFLRTDDLPADSPARRVTSRQMLEGMRRLSPDIAATAARYRLEPALLHAVIQVESGYDSGAVSRAGAVGLMQLMPATARRYGAADRRNPKQNLDAGARYLSDLLRQFSGDLNLALAAYNAGENAVLRHGFRIPPYAETLAYVPAVLDRYRQMKLRLN